MDVCFNLPRMRYNRRRAIILSNVKTYPIYLFIKLRNALLFLLYFVLLIDLRERGY
jgi:hypothetical protein